jgi:hypothetical protein
MNLQHRRFNFSLLGLIASLAFVPAACQAQLLPPGDYNGKSLEQWSLDWNEWAIKTDLGGLTLPDTVDGVRYGPPTPQNVSEFVADFTIQQGTAVLFSPFFVFGERYEDGSEDPVSAIDEFMLFETATFQITLNDNVVLEGHASDFPDRKTGVRVFSEPITYLMPQDRGGIKAVAAIFDQGIGAMFELPLGEHTITNVLQSDFFGGPFTTTYNITVVPEPMSLIPVGIGALSLTRYRRRRRSQGGTSR